MRLHTDITDHYIEKIEQFNYCGEKINERFYLRVARYNIFGRKRYIRVQENSYSVMDSYRIDRVFKTEYDVIKYYKGQLSTTKVTNITKKICQLHIY